MQNIGAKDKANEPGSKDGANPSVTSSVSYADPPYKIVDLYDAAQSKENYAKSVERHNYRLLWTNGVNCILGIWLITSPFLFDYKSMALANSDMIAGALLILFEALSFPASRVLLRWCSPAVGLWLLMAPLIFWSPTPAVYLQDSLIGALIIAFSMLIPGVPGLGDVPLDGPDQPPGWTYNPSSWIRRFWGIVLALVGFGISRYLAVHQLGYSGHAFDPFFGDGSDKVLHSAVSRSFPISDAGFGGVAYIMEVLSSFMGDRARWRTAPWTVVMFALLVIPLGATSVILVVTQPIFVGHWCGFCLIAATALLTSVPLAVHEAVAVGQFLFHTYKQKKQDFWRVFWFGATTEGSGRKDPDRLHFSLYQRWLASVQGCNLPWTLIVQIFAGLWLMARPDLIASGRSSANCDHLLGAAILTVAAISTAEVTRITRYLNVMVGLALVIVAVAVSRDTPIVLASEIVSGIVVALCSMPRGEIVENYASWNRFVR